MTSIYTAISATTHKPLGFVLALLVLGSLSAQAYAGAWRFDKNTSVANFSLSVWGKPAISGSFNQFDGTANFADATFATGEQAHAPVRTPSIRGDALSLTIPMNSLKVNLPERYAFLAKIDLFNAKQHPNMRFASRRIHHAADSRLKIMGELEFMGKRRHVVFYGKLAPAASAKQMGFTATTILKRSDFGVKVPLPGLSDNIPIEVKGLLLPAP